MKKVRISAITLAALASSFFPLAADTAQGQAPQPRLILVESSNCPDWEGEDSHALLIDPQADLDPTYNGYLNFWTQDEDAVSAAVLANLGGDDLALVDLISVFVCDSLSERTYSRNVARHVTLGGLEESKIMISTQDFGYSRSVIPTGPNGKMMVLGEFTIELIDASNSEFAECDDNPNNNYCGAWRIRSSASPLTTKQICLAIGFFSN